MYRLLFSGLFLLFGGPSLWATHIVGGEITYRCLGNDQYEITLSVYRDCYNGEPPFDNPASVGVFDENWNLQQDLRIPYIPGGDDTLNISLSNPCLIVPPDVCVHRFFYRDTVSLPFVTGGYTLVYQRCCRNKLIRNLPIPLDAGGSYIARITERTLLECNNSAVFRSWPPVAICIHQPVNFDHSATDADGDSLVYRLCTPLNGATPLIPTPQPPNPGPYEALIWQDPPYNLGNLLGGDPLTVDAHTGLMTGVPNTIGNFVVGVCVDEYRTGSIISTTRRDFQFNVSDCGQLAAAFFAPEVVCDSLQVKLVNQSNGTTSFRWYFDWPGDLSQTSTTVSPVHTYPDTGTYVIALIAAPNSPCRDTNFQEVHFTNGLPIIVTATPDYITPGQSSQLLATLPAGTAFTWSPVATLSDPTLLDPLATPMVTTTYTITAPDTNDCPLIGRVRVVVQAPTCAEPYIFFPTGFSPNGDGENDGLQLEGNFIETAYWTIYNRWGERVFEAHSANDIWDGTFRGEPLPAETYGYYLRVVCGDGQTAVRKGNVTLLR